MNALRGKSGLEIGGPSGLFENVLPVYHTLKKLDDFSFPRPVEWGGRELIEGKTYQYTKIKPCGRQYMGDATDLSIIPSETYDCLIASHVFEHIANSIKALSEWRRVLKDKGYMLLVVPHKEGTFDHLRPVTTLAHLIHDYEKNVDENDDTHFDEILRLTDYSKNKKIHNCELMQNWMDVNNQVRGMHHHVFDTELVLRLCNYVNLKILTISHILSFHIIVLCEKVKKTNKFNNESFLGPAASWRRKSPFAMDKK